MVQDHCAISAGFEGSSIYIDQCVWISLDSGFYVGERGSIDGKMTSLLRIWMALETFHVCLSLRLDLPLRVIYDRRLVDGL